MDISDIFLFAKAVRKHYIILLTGSTAVAIAAVWEHYRGASIGWSIFFTGAALLLIGAFFRAWRDEHLSRLNEQSKRISIESEVAKIRAELDAERSKKGLEEVQMKLAEANLERLTVENRKREEQEKHDERIRFLTAPDTGIRFYAREQKRLRQLPDQAIAFSVNDLITGMCAQQGEIEEAVRILNSRGLAKGTAFPGHWAIY